MLNPARAGSTMIGLPLGCLRHELRRLAGSGLWITVSPVRKLDQPEVGQRTAHESLRDILQAPRY